MSEEAPGADVRPPVSDFKAVLSSDPAEVEAVRTAVRRMACEGHFSDRADDLALALAEIVANAQEHGGPPVLVHAWDDGRIVVEVNDRGGGFDHGALVPDSPPRHGGHRGRGLWIARQLVDVMTITTRGNGTTVRLELSPEPHIGA